MTEKFDDEQWDAQGSGFCLYRKENMRLTLNSLLRAFAFPWDTQIDAATLQGLVERSRRHFGEDFATDLADVFAFWTEHLEVILAVRQKQREQLAAQYTISTSWRVTPHLRCLSRAVGTLRCKS